jgi:hypothetical protein
MAKQFVVKRMSKSLARRGSGFKYLRDPVFLAAAALYLLGRLVLKLLTVGQSGPLQGFLRGQYNDVLCIPFCLPPLLLFARWIGIRRHDGSPTRVEVLGCLGLWSVVFEWIAPRLPVLFASAIGDPEDVVAYAGGAIIAGLIWGVFRPAPHPTATDASSPLNLGKQV